MSISREVSAMLVANIARNRLDMSRKNSKLK